MHFSEIIKLEFETVVCVYKKENLRVYFVDFLLLAALSTTFVISPSLASAKRIFVSFMTNQKFN